jgi:hypothetical protein
MSEYQVPRVLWESLESVLLAQGRLFVKDVAKRLDVDEKELLKKVMPSSKIKVYLHDTETEDLKCQAYIQTGVVKHHCRRPVVLGSEFCIIHRHTRVVMPELPEENHVVKLEDSAERPQLWKRLDNSVIDSYGNCVGKYIEDSCKLILFKFE